MLSLRSSNSATERVAEAGGSLVTQTGRAARKTNASTAIVRKAAKRRMRDLSKPRRCCLQTEKASPAARGSASRKPSGNSKMMAAVMESGCRIGRQGRSAEEPFLILIVILILLNPVVE